MDILDRIKMIMKMNQLNAASFADRIGVQRSNVSHVLTGRNKPSLDFIEKILIQFPKVNASWLISGQIQQTDVVTPVIESAVKQSMSSSVEGTIVTIPEYISSADGTKNQDPNKIKSNAERKKIVKIITFYEDFTFDEYKPNVE